MVPIRELSAGVENRHAANIVADFLISDGPPDIRVQRKGKTPQRSATMIDYFRPLFRMHIVISDAVIDVLALSACLHARNERELERSSPSVDSFILARAQADW
jgi:hypothetical protein